MKKISANRDNQPTNVNSQPMKQNRYAIVCMIIVAFFEGHKI